MNLNFLGRGSAFNTKEGNTSAYYKSCENMLLIDCGETVFTKLIETKTLDDVKNLFVAVTHTHPDHIASLGTLIFYMYYIKQTKLNLILTPTPAQNEIIKNYLKISGVSDSHVNYVTSNSMLENFKELSQFVFLPTPHSKNMFTFGILLNHIKDGITYYSADTNSSCHLENYINSPNLDKIYMDTSKLDYDGSNHFSAKKLQEVVPANLRHKVYCMHIDDSTYIKELNNMGFNVVENVKINKKTFSQNNDNELEQ